MWGKMTQSSHVRLPYLCFIQVSTHVRCLGDSLKAQPINNLSITHSPFPYIISLEIVFNTFFIRFLPTKKQISWKK